MQRHLYTILLATPLIAMAACAIDDPADSTESNAPADDTLDSAESMDVADVTASPAVADTDDDTSADEPATDETPDAGPDTAHKKSQPFNKTWTFKSRPLQKCVIFTLKGKIRYLAQPTTIGRVSGWDYQDQTLVNPTITADVHDYANGSCIGPATLTKLSMRQAWTGYECSFNPSLGISGPWGISLSGWPSCGPRNVLGIGTTYPVRSANYVQSNSKSSPGFGEHLGLDRPCYGVIVTAKAYVGAHSDSFAVSEQPGSTKPGE